METVQLQCGNCRKLMAISVEHLGGQVQCPHCKSVVQTPTPPPAPEPAPEPPTHEQAESIFAPSPSTDADAELSARPSASIDPDAPSTPSAETQAQFAQFKPRPIFTATLLPLIALVFLVPYSLVVTAFVVYLLFFAAPRAIHPLDMLPDPAPDKKQGGPRQVSKISPNSNLGDHQFVGMGMTKQIGDIAATPQRVELTADGDLKLVLRAKNMSANTAFDPIHEVFVRYSAAKPSAQPYSFLETKSHKFDNIYGAYLSYGNDEEQSVLLRPGQETTITLKTYEVHRHIVAKISESAEPMVWRVQLRRGLVKWKGKDVSTTTVFGVEFTTAQIDRTKKDA